MHSFVNNSQFEEQENEGSNYLITERIKGCLPILQKTLQAKYGSVVTISGSRGSGRHSLIHKLISESNKSWCLVDIEEIREDGKLDISKLIRLIRSVVQIGMKENFKVVEGEVVSISNDKIQLKTRDMESVFDIGVRIRNELERERVCIGDIVKIYKENCYIIKQGRTDNRSSTIRSDIIPRLELPEGECIKNEVIQTFLNLNELDILNFKENGEEYLYRDVCVSEYVRAEVDKKIIKLLKEEKAELIRGVLIIDGCDCLTEEEIKTISWICNGTLHPTLFLIFDQTDNGKMKNEISVNFTNYSDIEISDILKKYCVFNRIEAENDAFELLSQISNTKGLSVGIKILKASIIKNSITVNSIKKIVDIFEE